MGACYLLLLAPLPERNTDQAGETATSAPSERVIVEGEVNPTQQAALEKLADETGETVDALAQNGQVRFLDAKVKIPDTITGNPQEKATYFLSKNSDLFQIQNMAGQLFFESSSTDEEGISYIRYSQRFKGIPVYGSSIVISISPQGEVLSIAANYLPNLVIDIQPAIRSIEAEKKILSEPGNANAQILGKTTLVIHAPEIWDVVQPKSDARLSWFVLAGSESLGNISTYVVDAKTGELLDRFSLGIEIGGEPDIEVRDAQGLTLEAMVLSGWLRSKLVMDENDWIAGATHDPTAAFIQQNAHKVYSYYWNTYHRDSYDDNGMLIKVYYNINDCWPRWIKEAKYNLISLPVHVNSIFMCQDWAENIDAMAHEFTHGVIAHSSDLVSQGESFALNEAYGDVFGAIIDVKDPWKTTKDLAGTQIRRRLDDPGPEYPIYYKDLVTLKAGEKCPTEHDDPPCPHTNSTIWSHAFYQIAVGGTVNGVNVQGIGVEKLQYIYYATMINLASSATFKEAARDTLDTCLSFSFLGTHNIKATDCEEIRIVFASIGLVEPISPISFPNLPSIPEIPNLSNPVYNLIEDLRKAVDNLLGAWSPIKLWQQFSDFIQDLRQNYWIKLVECINKSDQACMDKYLQDLLAAILEKFLQALNESCASIFLIPIVLLLFHSRRRKRMLL